MKDAVRIVVVGDEKVGKTSIIEVLITATFEESVQPVLPVLVVPKDVTPERVHVSIVDTPGAESQVSTVDEELSKADVVVLVYSVNDEATQGRVRSYWLKKFRTQGLKVPVILVGNKIDTRGGITDPAAAAKMEAFIKPIMDNYREVDVCIECSAKTVSNISEVFYFAQKAVLHPTGPLYDVDKHALKAPAAAALKRIFHICDKDRDGGLNDKELNDFQFMCFGVHLKAEELAGVKKVVQENRREDGIRPDGSISVEGFTFLHTLFVQKGRLETTWIVLRKFGYDDDMRINLNENEKVSCRKDQSVELSVKGKQFLSQVFAKCDKDIDSMLSPSEMKKVFADHPDGAFAIREPNGSSVRLTHKGPESREEYVTLDAFMARWAIYVQDSPNDALVSLLHIGYLDSPQSALKVTKSRKSDRYNHTVSRDVFSVLLLGNDYPEKCDVIRGLVGQAATGEDIPGIAAVARMKDPEGTAESKKIIVMRDNRDITAKNLPKHTSSLEAADVLCILFKASSPDSFEAAKSLWKTLDAMKGEVKIPVVFVASVADGEHADVMKQADALCLEAELPTPVRVSMKHNETANLYSDLLGVAMHPDVACPTYYESAGSSSTTILQVAIGTLAISGAVYCAKRLYDYYTTKPNTN